MVRPATDGEDENVDEENREVLRLTHELGAQHPSGEVLAPIARPDPKQQSSTRGNGCP
jgi:hypothetical protein